MKDSVAEMLVQTVGILVGIALIMFVALLSSKSHEIGGNIEDNKAKYLNLNQVADAQYFVDSTRQISGDDMVEFITDNGSRYAYIIKTYEITTKDGKDIPDKTRPRANLYVIEGGTLYNDAKNRVKAKLTDVPAGEAETYASTALWSQYYLTTNVLGDRLTSQFTPHIYVNRSGKEGANNVNVTDPNSGWKNVKGKDSNGNDIEYSFLDVYGSEDEFVIVYDEVGVR